jgi:uncharacterized protein YndB with AHSA1/START domain
MAVKFTVQLKIRKPVAEVFDAVVDDKKMSGYFISKASGPLVAGRTVMWSFPEFPGEAYPVEVDEVVPNERIRLRWDADKGRDKTRIEMVFKPIDAGATLVQISESGWNDDEAGLKASHGNAAGWMHMMMGLKGSLEYGINLREGGAF